MYRKPLRFSVGIQGIHSITNFDLGGLLLAVMIAGSLVGCRSTKYRPSVLPDKESLNARVWVSRGKIYTFPEHEYGVRPRTGICLSGGGTRALTAAMGQLRGLRALKLLRHVDYISSVSGGTWACTAFTYYRSGAENDDEFLGPITNPDRINDCTLQHLPRSRLGHTATRDFEKKVFALLENPCVPRDQVWIRAVGATFLEPFGLFSSKEPNSHYFSSDHRRVTAIKERNPPLQEARFHTVRKNEYDAHRPYLVANSCLVWPVDDLRRANLVPFEYTPLYVGNPYRLQVCYQPFLEAQTYRTVGGGYLEPFAYGSQAPAASPSDEGFVQVEKRRAPFSLAEAAGTSSAAYAVKLDPFGAALSPRMQYWPVTGTGGEPTHHESFGDGGSLENFGLIALLRRKVKNIVVFVNTDVKLSLEYSPSNGRLPSKSEMTDRLPQLFGVPIRTMFSQANPYPHNQVFLSDEFAGVVRKLQDAKCRGRGVVATSRHVVQSNDWWGVAGNWTVNICWVYLDRAPEWEKQLPEHIRHEIEEGNRPFFPHGPFKHFPNYDTIDEDFPYLVKLTKPQVNLMADLSCWIVMQHENKFAQFLRPSGDASD